MLTKRIIPTILIDGQLLVKGSQFVNDRIVGNAMMAAMTHSRRQVDEILLLDVKATKQGREPPFAIVNRLTAETFVPITVGGGIGSMEDVDKLFRAGADKLCIGSRIDLIPKISSFYGRQAVIAAVDYHENDDPTGIETIAFAMQKAGAGEILLQCVDRDGTMSGYNHASNQFITHSERITVPVIVSGGCSGYDDMLRAIEKGADAVAAGALFQFTNATPRLAAEFLNQNRVNVRL